MKEKKKYVYIAEWFYIEESGIIGVYSNRSKAAEAKRAQKIEDKKKGYDFAYGTTKYEVL